MSRGRAFRRNKMRKEKDQARWLWKKWCEGTEGEATGRWVGIMARTHCSPCSCWTCKGPKGRPTRQELASKLRLDEQYQEFWEDARDWLQYLNRKRTRVRLLRAHTQQAEDELAELKRARWPNYPWAHGRW